MVPPPKLSLAFFLACSYSSANAAIIFQNYSDASPLTGVFSAWSPTVETVAQGGTLSLVVEKDVALDYRQTIEAISAALAGLSITYKPSYQWYKNGSALTGKTASTLRISPITTADAGAYSVTARNIVGTITSASLVVQISLPPTISIQPNRIVTGKQIGRAHV